MTQLTRYLLPPDVFCRHLLIARELEKIKKGSCVLDVGGSLGELKKFTDRVQIKTVDVAPGGDVTFDGDNLPFKDNEFVGVVSVDTLEHVPTDKRIAWLKELYRVARETVIVIAPFGSSGHVKYENSLLNSYKKKGLKAPGYLMEHVHYGLPDQGLLDKVESEFKSIQLFYVGDIRQDKRNFKVHLFEVKNNFLNRLIYYLKFIWNVKINLVDDIGINSQPHDYASRVIFIMTK